MDMINGTIFSPMRDRRPILAIAILSGRQVQTDSNIATPITCLSTIGGGKVQPLFTALAS